MATTLQIARHDVTKAALCFLYAGAAFGLLGAGTQHAVVGATSFCLMTFIHGVVFVVSHILHL